MNSPDRQPLNTIIVCTIGDRAASPSWAGPSTCRRSCLVGGGLATLSIAAWLQTRQWRLRHSLLSSDYQAVTIERSQAEQARLQAEVFYHSLVETIPQMILCKDLDGRFTFANQKFCARAGNHARELQGEDRLRFLPQPSWPKSIAATTRKSSRAGRSSTSSKSTSRPGVRSSTSRS